MNNTNFLTGQTKPFRFRQGQRVEGYCFPIFEPVGTPDEFVVGVITECGCDVCGNVYHVMDEGGRRWLAREESLRRVREIAVGWEPKESK